MNQSTAKSHRSHLLHVKVTPSAVRNEITGVAGGVLQVKIAAPPVKGKANRELLSFLSQTLAVSKASFSIVKGQTSRNKVIAIEGLSRDEALKRLLV